MLPVLLNSHPRSLPLPASHASAAANATRRNTMPTFITGVAPGYAGAATYRTHSVPGPSAASVVVDRDIDLSPPRDDEIIIATVRVRSPFRRLSVEENANLPERPSKRSYLSRLGRRLSHAPAPDSRDRFTAVKMPRRAYRRWFARDAQGRYAGTERPEREWDEEELWREFGGFQGMALRSVPGEEEGRVSGGGSVDGEEGVSGEDRGKEEDGEGEGKEKRNEEMWWL